MQLFYEKNIDQSTKDYTFSKEESRHIVRVLRKKEGDLLQVTNGCNELFTGIIIDANDKRCKLEITAYEKKGSPRNYKLGIAIAPTKNNTRFEWFLEKATELGVDEILPIFCEHSERKIIKPERMRKHLQAAMKQSLQYQLPQFHELEDVQKIIITSNYSQKFIARCNYSKDDAIKNSLFSKLVTQEDTLVLIGPEGGFSDFEIQLALENSFIPVSLGTSRLRTETAGISAIHTINLKNNL